MDARLRRERLVHVSTERHDAGPRFHFLPFLPMPPHSSLTSRK